MAEGGRDAATAPVTRRGCLCVGLMSVAVITTVGTTQKKK